MTDRTIKDLSKVPLDNDGDEEKYFMVGAALSLEQKTELVTLLREYADVFALSTSDMPGVPSEVACH